MTAIALGQKAPNFELPDAQGELVKLSDFHGKKVVLYFYPKDDTPGCTKEACDFRDALKTFERANTVILGVSPDDSTSHGMFRDKFHLSFPLLSDPDHLAAIAYGVYKEKNMYGKKVMGIERSTFVIDEEGSLLHEMRKVKVEGHIEEVLSLVS